MSYFTVSDSEKKDEVTKSETSVPGPPVSEPPAPELPVPKTDHHKGNPSSEQVAGETVEKTSEQSDVLGSGENQKSSTITSEPTDTETAPKEQPPVTETN